MEKNTLPNLPVQPAFVLSENSTRYNYLLVGNGEKTERRFP